MRLYDTDGMEIGFIPKILEIQKEKQFYTLLNLNQLITVAGFSIRDIAMTRIECEWLDKSKIPTRVKFGLNIGTKDDLPCNICFAPQIGNPNILLKKGTFKWSPILNHTHSEIVITNSSTLKCYSDTAEVDIKIYREIDNECIERKITLPPFGIHKIDVSSDPELKKFINNQTGWATFTSSNPFIYGWYFDFNSKGVVAADHIF
jgi:hypothetical protein